MKKNEPERKSKDSISDSVMASLVEMISEMDSGDRIPSETSLAEQFSVGRSTIRECLKVLSFRHIIVRRQEGTFVAKDTSDYLGDSLELFLDLKIGNINELVELREYLESIVVRLAARRASPEDIALLERANWRLCEPGLSEEECSIRDFEFHKQLALCANNSILADIINSLRGLIQKTLEKNPMPDAFAEKGMQFHSQIIAAIKDHDETEAIRIMESYLIEADYTS